jgi:hypothetical protein
MSKDNKDIKAGEAKEGPKETTVLKKVREIQNDVEVLKLLEEDEDDFE